MKAKVIYWTGSGNTQMMADSVFESLEDHHVEAELFYVSDVSADEVKDADILFLGCPSMSGEDVEEYEFRPFFDDLKPFLDGKTVVMFGSYDWGEGEWMDSWIEEMKSVNADIKKTFIYQWEPTDEQLKEIYDGVAEIIQ